MLKAIENQLVLSLFIVLCSASISVSAQANVSINDMAWNIDGTRLAVARNGGVLSIYDSRLTLIGEFMVSNDLLTSVEWRPNVNDELAVSSRFGEIFVLRIQTTAFQVITELDPVQNYVRKITWSPDGQYLATIGETGGGASSEHALHVWEVSSGAMIATFAPYYSLTDLAWNPSHTDELLISGIAHNEGTHLLLWRPFADTVVWQLERQTSVTNIAWRPDGQQFAAFTEAFGDDGAILTLHDAATGAIIASLPTALKSRSAVIWDIDSHLIVSGSLTIEIWNPKNSRLLVTTRLQGAVLSFSVRPESTQLVYEANDGELATFSLPIVCGYAQTNPITYRMGDWSPDDSLIALIDTRPARDIIQIYSSNLEPITTLELNGLPNEITQVDGFELAWSSDNTKLAAVLYATDNVALSETYIVVWETQTWTETLRLKNRGLNVSWSPDGNFLATGSRIYDATTGEFTHILGNFFRISYVVWHPTNINQVLLGFDTQIGVYDLKAGISLFDYPYYFSNEPNFSPDGRYLAFEQRGSAKVVDVLDTSTYQLFASLEYQGNLSEGDGLNWIGNDALALTILDSPIPVIDISTGNIVDMIFTNAKNIWNTQGTGFLALTNNRCTLAVLDARTEGIISQFAPPSTVRNLSLVQGPETSIRPLLAGTSITNDILSDEAADGLIAAFTYPEEVGSVVFDLNGVVSIENTAPFTLPVPLAGTYTLSATPYSAVDGQGEPGLAFTVVIRVLEDTSELNPADTAHPMPEPTHKRTNTPAPANLISPVGNPAGWVEADRRHIPR